MADDFGVRAKAALPEPVTENDRQRLALLIFFRQEGAAKQGSSAKERKERRRHPRAFDVLWRSATGEVIAAAERRRDLLEDMIFGLDVEVLARRKPILHDVQSGRAIPQDDQTVGVFVRQRAQQQGVGDAEDGAVRADADGQ